MTSSLRGMILAVSPEGVIGLHGGIPWRHPGDHRRFKRVTSGATVIMGRRTWESMGGRPLPHRRNLVVTSHALEGVETFRDLESALAASEGPVWFVGGRAIYAEAMRLCDVIDVTYVPDHVVDPDAVHAPPIDPSEWVAGPLLAHEDEPGLTRRVYTRRAPREK